MRVRYLPVAIVGGVLAAILTACSPAAPAPSPAVPATSATPAVAVSGTSTPLPSPTATPTPVSPSPSPTPTATPTPDLAAIGKLYLAAATKANRASSDAHAQVNAATTNRELQAAYRAYVKVFVEAQRDVKAIKFPRSIQRDVDALLAAYRTHQQTFERLARDPSYDPGTRISDTAKKLTAAGARIRAFLGLPPPPAP